MSDEIIDDYVITDDWGEDNALIFPDGGTSSGGNTPSPVVTPANFGRPGEATIVGTIGGAQWGEVGGAFSCKNGTLTVPLPAAAKYSSGTITTSSPGLIGGVDFSKTDTTSEIDSGMIKLAAANAASRCNGTTDGTPGGIHGIGYSNNGEFAITKGFALIPKPTGPTDGIDGLYNAETAKGMTWAELRGAGPVRLSYSDSHGYGVTAMMFNNFLSLFIS